MCKYILYNIYGVFPIEGDDRQSRLSQKFASLLPSSPNLKKVSPGISQTTKSFNPFTPKKVNSLTKQQFQVIIQ